MVTAALAHLDEDQDLDVTADQVDFTATHPEIALDEA